MSLLVDLKIAGIKPEVATEVLNSLENEDQIKELLQFVNDNKHYLQKFANYENLELTCDDYNTNKCVVSVLNNVVVIIPLSALVNIEEERNKLLQEEQKMNNEIKRCQNMLSNPNFVSKAPAFKIEQEKEKLASYEARLVEIKKLLLDL